jgi:hypothetical protein
MRITDLPAKLAAHVAWLRGEPNGVRLDLYGANLYGANLGGANLYGADLGGCNLAFASLPFPIIQLGPLGSRNDYLVYRPDIDQARTGCFVGTLAAFEAAVATIHGGNRHGHDYQAAITFLRSLAAPDEQPVAPLPEPVEA